MYAMLDHLYALLEHLHSWQQHGSSIVLESNVI
jgi:hypothetical protein